MAVNTAVQSWNARPRATETMVVMRALLASGTGSAYIWPRRVCPHTRLNIKVL